MRLQVATAKKDEMVPGVEKKSSVAPGADAFKPLKRTD